MEVQFKKETLFEKFKLSSSLSKGELMRLFQTRPELRKELPVHIQTINSDAKLFVEELFSTYIDNDFYTVEKYVQDRKSVEQLESVFDTEITSSVSSRKKLAALINLVRNFDYHVLPTLIQEVILLVLPIVVVDVMLLLAFMAHMIARKYGRCVASVMTLLALLGMVVPLSNYITRLVLHL